MAGLISNVKDAFGYLGHFRRGDVLKRGHNQGGPEVPQLADEGGYGPPMSTPTLAPPLPAPAAVVPVAPRVNARGRTLPSFDPMVNPIRAQRQAGRAAVQQARATGGDVRAVRQQNRADLGTAKVVRNVRDALGLRASDRTAARGAKKEARVATRAARNTANTTAATQQPNAMNAKQGLRSAVQAVRNARQGIRESLKGRK